MNIHGIGVVFARGRGVPALERALAEGWQPPAAGAPRLSYAVPPEALADRAAAPGLRRADRFSRLATLAAWDALRADGAPELAPARVGAIVATAFGPHVTTFKFLDDILSFGDAAVSPTTFSHSVHNAAAAYIAAALGLRGPTLTVTQFAFAFHEALRLAAAWIGEGRCDAVLVGAADEMGGVLARIAARKLRVAADGKIRPFAFAPSPATVPGEGAAFLLLSPAPSGAGFGRIADVTVGAGPRERPRPDAQLLDADGMAEDETGYAAAVRPDAPAAGYAPLWGGMPAGSAFSCAAAAVMLRAQRLFATPVADEAPGVAVCRETAAARIERVVCAKRDCQSRTGMITLARRWPG